MFMLKKYCIFKSYYLSMKNNLTQINNNILVGLIADIKRKLKWEIYRENSQG